MESASEGSPGCGQPVPRANLKGGGVFGEKFEPPEAPRHRSPELLRGGGGRNPKIQRSPKTKEKKSIGKNARPRNQAFGRFQNLRMLYLDFHPMSIFSRKNFLYNKTLATTLEGSQKILAQSLARSGCKAFDKI